MQKRTYKKHFISAIVCLGAMMTFVSEATEEPDDSEDTKTIHELPPYVVVATRTPLPLNQVSPSTAYISEQEIIQNQDRSLVDVLKRQPGIVLNTTGARGAQTSLFIRGTESDHTGFFMDGRRLNPGFFNLYNLEFLPVDNLSSIEVQRGPSSVNFGSAGIGGVVSLQTRSSLGEKEKSIKVESEYGSYDTYQSAVTGSFSDETWALNMGTSVFSTDNKRDNDDFERLNVNGRFEYALSEYFIVELLGFATQTDKEVAGPVTNPSSTDEGETESLLISPGLRYENGNWSGRVFYSKNVLTLDNRSLESDFSAPFPFPEALVDSGSTVKSDEVYGQLNYESPLNALLSLGALYRNDDVTNSNLDFFDTSLPARPFSERFEQVGLWIQSQWKPTDRLEIRLGGRYDNYTDYDSSIDGSIEVLYSFNKLGSTLFAKLSTSYAPPSASDIAFDSDPTGTPLNPEESDAYEVGLKQSLLDERLRLSTVVFRNEIEEYLIFEPVTFDTRNSGDATTEGIEFTADYEPIKKLNFSVAYTYLVALDDTTDTRLLRRPRHLIQLSTDYQMTESWFVAFQGIGYFDRKDIDASFNTVDHEDYFVVNLITDYKIDECIRLFARVENLLDEDYESVLGFPALGRTGYIGARLSF